MKFGEFLVDYGWIFLLLLSGVAVFSMVHDTKYSAEKDAYCQQLVRMRVDSEAYGDHKMVDGKLLCCSYKLHPNTETKKLEREPVCFPG